MTKYECIFFYIYILSLIFIIEIVCVLFNFTKKNCILEFLRVCSKRSWFLFSMKGAPLGFWQEKTWIVG